MASVREDSGPHASVMALPQPSRRARFWWWVVLVLLASGYAALRLTMNEEYRVAPWAAIVELRAPLPFGHRVLVPLLARPLVDAGVSLRLVLGGFEAFATAGLMAATAWTLRPHVGQRLAMAAGLGILCILPWPYLLPHEWPIFYPWDTPAMALLMAGLGAIDRRRWGLSLGIAAAAALNRESAILLPVVAVLWVPPRAEDWRPALARVAGLVAVVLFVRMGVALTLPDNPGPPVHFTIGKGEYRVFNNLRWLSDPLHVLAAIPSLAAWPLCWPLMRSAVAPRMRRLWLVAWMQTAGLLLVANIYEPRAFGEVLVLAYVPSLVGGARWLGLGPEHEAHASPRWLRVVDRHGAWLVALAFIAFVLALQQWSFLPVAQWPMPR
ncbi:MAG: hypothetical protein AAF799_21510 [Myxococcota bacterium]